MTEVLKYHVKRGTRIPLFQDGWTKEGREYYQQLCDKFCIILTSNGPMAVLRMHWNTFVKKFHKKSYYRLQPDLGEDVDEIENDSGDDDCIVLLPGELDEGISDDESERGTTSSSDCSQFNIMFEGHFNINQGIIINKSRLLLFYNKIQSR